MRDDPASEVILDQEFEERLAERRRKRLATIEPDTLTFIALVPVWSQELADATGFSQTSDWETSLSRAQALRLLDNASTTTAEGEISLFWISDTARPWVVEYLRREQDDPDYLLKKAAEIGERIYSSAEQGVSVPQATLRWAQLAQNAKGGSAAIAQTLSSQVRELFAANKTAGAEDWLNTGDTLAKVFGEELVNAVALGNRRVELSYRQALDERYLKQFVRRKEQIRAFEELIEGSGDQWALHYLGMGGVGKTMLLRHIGYHAPKTYEAVVGRIDFDYLSPDYPVRRPGQLLLALAEDLRLHFTKPSQETSYDRCRRELIYLHEILSDAPPPEDPLANVEHPRFRGALEIFSELLRLFPGRVVLVLDTCEELIKEQLGGGKLPHLRATFQILEDIHEMVPEARVVFAGRRLLTKGGAGWQVNLKELAEARRGYLLEPKAYLRLHLMRGFSEEEALRLFAKFEREHEQMPEDVRLAILQASFDHGTPAAVYDSEDRRPLVISPALYDRLLRALLAYEAARGPEYLSRLSSDERLSAWLRGLSGVEEAGDRGLGVIDRLYDKHTQKQENALVLLLHAIAKDVDDTAFRKSVLQSAEELEIHLRRYSPFALTLYAQWYQDEPGLTAATIQSGQVDAYVEMRIINRINQEDVRELLPAAVLLRRFDARMLRPAFAGSRTAFAEAFRSLSDQEWMDYYREPDSDKVLLEVDPNLYGRLLDYYRKTEPAKLAVAEERLAPELARRVRETPLGELSVECINAALTLLPDREAALRWGEIERRIPEQTDWNWGLNVTRYVLGEELGAAGKGNSLLRAAVYATHTAASTYLSTTYDASDNWRAIGQMVTEMGPWAAESMPGIWLTHRALLGQIAATRITNQRPPDEQLKALWQILDSRVYAFALTAPLLAALEAVMDRAERTGDRELDPGPVRLQYWTDRLRGSVPRELLAFASLLAGRALAFHGQWDEAKSTLYQIDSQIDKLTAAASKDELLLQSWTDWRMPGSIRDRIRLETLRVLPLSRIEIPELEYLGETEWLAEIVNLIDRERLLSSIVQWMLRLEPISVELLENLSSVDEYVPSRQPVCLAHDETPPLFVSLAQAWLARGRVDRALDILDQRLRAATEFGQDAQTVGDATRGIVQVVRQMRLFDRAKRIVAQESTVGWPTAQSWPMMALTGVLAWDELPKPQPEWSAERVHLWWSSQYDSTPEQISNMSGAVAAPQDEQTLSRRQLYEAVARQLDAQEAWLVASQTEAAETDVPVQEPVFTDTLYEQFFETAQAAQPGADAIEALRLMLRWIALQVPRQPEAGLWRQLTVPSSDGVPESQRAIGARRVGEIALEEGELLALRLPAQAVDLLAAACGAFTEANDPLGAMKAAILATGAAIRAGDEIRARSQLEQIALSYKWLVESEWIEGLPAWEDQIAAREELAAAPSADGRKWLEMLTSSPLYGWQVRLFGCLVWEAIQDRAADAEAKETGFDQYLADRFGERLPAEMRFETKAELAAVEDAGSTEPSWGTIVRYALLGCAISLAVLVGLYFGYRWVLDRILPVQIGTGWSIGSYVLLWILFALSPRGVRAIASRIRAWWAAKTEVELGISAPVLEGRPPSLPTETTVALYVQHTPMKLRLRPRPFLYRPKPIVEEGSSQVQVSLRQPYAEMAQGIPENVAEVLQQLQKRLHKRKMAIPLDVAYTVAPYPWEALLTLASRDPEEQEWQETYQFWRAEKGGGIVHGAWEGGEIRVVCSETWYGRFRGGWEGREDKVSVHSELYWAEEETDFKVLHLVGVPDQTKAGMQLQIENGGDAAAKYTQESAVARGGNVVSTDDVRSERVWLVVVQAKPVEEATRGEVNRADAAYLRTFAAEVFAGGARAVVVIPALPPALVQQALLRLSGGLRAQSPPDRQQLLDVVSDLRETIAGWRGTSEAVVPQDTGDEKDPSEPNQADVMTELALDVCLFWRRERG
jgi:hypothetical protein